MALAETVLQQLDPDLRSYIEQLEERSRDYTVLEQEYHVLQERYRLLLYKRFRRSSEQEESTYQKQLFSEAEDTATIVVDDPSSDAEAATESEQTTVGGHTRSKPGRKAIDAKHPRIEIVHDIPEENKICGCDAPLVRIGEDVKEIIQIIPEQIWVERHIFPKYACHVCEGSGDEDHPAVRVAPREPTILPRSIASPSLLAFVLMNKFVDHLPFYRQEKRFERIGIAISRQDMSNWTIAAARKIQPLINEYKDQMRGGPLINMDETPLQVMNEPERENTQKSYMWLARGGPPDTPVVLYTYHPSRGIDCPQSVLEGYSGYVQTDGYAVYERLAKEGSFIHVGCWTHTRRKFHEAAQASKKAGAAQEGLAQINRIYRIERDLRNKDLSPEAFVLERKMQVAPVLSSFRKWLEKKSERVVPSSLVGTAVAYTLKEWDTLVRYLDHAGLTPDNNAAENSIRPFVLGRKNWLISGSPRGATASCTMYSLIETAKLNGLDPFAYLHYVFTKAPEMKTSENWQSLLPENLTSEILTKALPSPLRNG